MAYPNGPDRGQELPRGYRYYKTVGKELRGTSQAIK